jgi:hypothetical protein
MILSSLEPSSKDTLKPNVDDSFLEDSLYLGPGGVVRNHEDDWVADISHYDVNGNVLLAELCVIQMRLDFVAARIIIILFVKVIT